MMPKEPEEGQPGEMAPEVTGAEDIETLKQGLVEEKARAENYLANWQRVQADFLNYKKRSQQEKEEIGQFANSVLLLSILPVIADLERALASVPPRLAKLSWVDGIKLIEHKFQTTLESQGLSPIKTVGEPFDPRCHEAVRQDKGEEGIVLEEIQKGYQFHDRVIRPAMVVVGNGDGEKETAPEKE